MKAIRLVLSAVLALRFQASCFTQPVRTTQGRSSSYRFASPILFRDDVTIGEDPRESGIARRKNNVDVFVHNDDQSEVDDYLEFLDRRYNRLHADDREKVSSFTWLRGDFENFSLKDVRSVRDIDYALRPLEVVGFAGRNLRQTFQINSHSTNTPGKSIIAPTAALLLVGGVPSIQAMSVVWASFASVATMISLLQKQIMKNSTFQFQTLVAFLSKDLNANAAKSARAVWRIGGGMKNLSWTLTVMSALVMLLVKPLTLIVGKETSIF